MERRHPGNGVTPLLFLLLPRPVASPAVSLNISPNTDMTSQDHARIACRWLDHGTVTKADRLVLAAAEPLANPLNLALERAVRGKVEALVQKVQAAPNAQVANFRRAEVRQLAQTPLYASAFRYGTIIPR